MNIYKGIKTKIKNYFNDKKFLFNIFLTFILITLPLKNIFVSIALIFFSGISLFYSKKENHRYQKELYIPIVFFFLMTTSLLWTTNFESSLFGIQKQLPFLVIPLIFLFLPKVSRESINLLFKIYSFSMVLFGLYYLIRAIYRYIEIQNTNFFFYNELVPIDPGAIYMSVFASFAMFYFLQINKKTNIENISLNLLVIFIFLLSSKTIISIDFLIIICYYSFFAEVPKSTKIATILSISLFLFFSIFFIKEVKERFFLEYQTAFVDNTLSSSQKELKASIHNVSIQEAWSSKRFHQNDFFPGTALRVYQIRVFTELITEQNIFLKGLGLEASQKQIENKAKQHNLYYDYRNYNFHNQYIQTFAEIGFFGFLILIIVVVLNFVNAWVKKDFLHIAFAITMIMLFLSESFFCRQRGIVFFIILYCLFNSTAREDRTLLVQ